MLRSVLTTNYLCFNSDKIITLYAYLGNETSAMYIKSVFETITGIWGLGIDSILDDGLPLVTSISITN